MAIRKPRLRAWLELLRLPNLFTVPGDPLVGFILAAGAGRPTQEPIAAAALAAGASLALYAAGLVHNDLCDLAEDRRERPNRPLPSGRVSHRAAASAYMLLLAGGVLLSWANGKAAVSVSLMLVASIILYNRFTKRIPVVGPVNMGLCRGLSLLLGAAAWGWGAFECLAVPLAAAMTTAYIASVTAIASRETAGRPVGGRRNLPPMILAFALAFFVLPGMDPPSRDVGFWAFAGLLGLAVFRAAACAVRLGGDATTPQVVQQTVGSLIRVLLPIQAAFCCLGEPWGIVVACVLLAAWPTAATVGRRFYAS